jgi:hypothetical protein
LEALPEEDETEEDEELEEEEDDDYEDQEDLLSSNNEKNIDKESTDAEEYEHGLGSNSLLGGDQEYADENKVIVQEQASKAAEIMREILNDIVKHVEQKSNILNFTRKEIESPVDAMIIDSVEPKIPLSSSHHVDENLTGKDFDDEAIDSSCDEGNSSGASSEDEMSIISVVEVRPRFTFTSLTDSGHSEV